MKLEDRDILVKMKVIVENPGSWSHDSAGPVKIGHSNLIHLVAR